ncbi:MAG: hypothetical protein MUC96_03070 [Myxococcaceae bacterium]|jgi:hypothetical protein|nr:hypothetical protein [Myxococcaceae bacterium]
MRTVIVILGIGLTILSSGCGFGASCTTDTDCPRGQKCLIGNVCGTSTPPDAGR